MDASNDLLLGVFANYSFEWLEAYMTSIVRCGFRGRKIFMVWNIEQDVRAKLTEYGFELIDVPPANMSVQFCHNFFEYRDKLAYEFLRDRWQEFRFVFWMDIRDLIFQTDPSIWMEENLAPHKIVIASECIRIKDETCNDNWAKAVFDTGTYTRLREFEVLNGGTFAGTADAMRDVFERVYKIAGGTSEIAEQAAINFVLRGPEFADITHIPRMSEGFAVVGYGFGNQLQHVWTDECPEMRHGILYPKGKTEPFSIVHQYDRHREWKWPIIEKYKSNLIPPARQRKRGYAVDGLTLDWWDTH
jgi:hypothetical protein